MDHDNKAIRALYGSCTKLVKLENRTNESEIDYRVPIGVEYQGFILNNEQGVKELVNIKKGAKIGIYNEMKELIVLTSELTDSSLVYLDPNGQCLAEKSNIYCGRDTLKVVDLLKEVIDSYFIFSTKTGVYSIHLYDEVKED